MPHTTVQEVNAWLEPTKLSQDSLDINLEESVVETLFARLRTAFNVSAWVDEETTPSLIRKIIAAQVAAWTYDRTYADDEEPSYYARNLRALAEANVAGLLSGILVLEEVGLVETGNPSFFPNDLSSANPPTYDNPSDGGPAFTMGTVF